jgi:hypothetical protein
VKASKRREVRMWQYLELSLEKKILLIRNVVLKKSWLGTGCCVCELPNWAQETRLQILGR